jgi:hypothetical protein
MSDAKKPDEKPTAMTFEEEAPVTSSLSIPGLEFEATTGRMPIKNDQGEILAQVFYVAYTKKGCEPGERPVTFTFNGGPGSPSIWLHMGAVGPFRAPMTPEGRGGRYQERERVLPDVAEPKRPLAFAALPGGRELWHHPCGGHGGPHD